MAITLTACDSDTDTEDTAPTTGTATEGEQATEDPNAELYSLYNQALDGLNLDNDRFNDPDNAAPLYDPTDEFEYSLVDVTGDDVPEMLVAAIGDPYKIAKLFTVTDGELIETGQLFADGAATGGGSRAEFRTSAEHNGVFKTLGRSGNGEYSTSRWTLEGDAMVESEGWEYRIDQKPADLTGEEAEIEWTPADDRSLLGGDAVPGTEAPDDGPNPDRPTPPATDAGEAPADTSSLPQDDFASPEQTGITCGTVDEVTVVAGSATSCGFAMNVAQQALQPGTWGAGVAPDPTVTAPWGSTTVTASSPATGETYTLSCNSGTDQARASCTGGNNAEVRFEKTAQGGLMYLLG
ncbi:hypothetical protein ACTXPL_12270 [Candidatus Corynebacterium faecigallinarum]